ncbi:MAG: nitrite reductase large subunit NirB [Deltaproteobacteria bacterium]
MRQKKGKERLVVIGNGMAGNACVEEILKLDPERFEITVFGRERHPNYNRVLLSHVLTGEKTIGDITLHDRGWYEKNHIRLHTACAVKEIRRGSRLVVAEGGVEARYDKLVFATGSYPVILPVPGHDKEGVVSFRDMDDCERIRSLSKTGGRAIVIGGGLLGLEAARGVLSLGMDTTVVHLMGRLMERQLDAAAAGFLKEDLEKLGIKVLLGKETAEISGDGKVSAVRFKDGTTVEADIVVMSVGIAPNTALAKSSGIYCQRGIVVSDCMQTYDPAVYSVGECIEHRGATFGLVGPIFEQARVLANHLAGDCRLVFKHQAVSTRLKIPGIDVYSAGAIDDGAGAESIEYIDRAARVYKRLIIRENILRGVVMYGDTVDAPRLFTSLVESVDISQKRKSLLFGEMAAGGKAASSVEAMPDDAIVCGCNGVTKKMIVEAIEKKGLFTRDDVKRETKASSSCGGCASVVDQILEATLGSNFQGRPEPANICGCTRYSRDDVIKNVRERGLKSVREVMETLGWETVGCDLCRPALNYYVSMVWPGESEDDQTSRLVNERAHANIQKDGAFSVVPRMCGGVTNPEELKRIADVAVKYRVPLVKFTGGQRIDLLGVKKDDLASIWKDLDMDSGFAYGKALRTVKTCVGARFCRYGTQDSLGLGQEMEGYLKGLWMPAKLKVGVAGCPRNCAESLIKDVGVVGVAGGWDIYVGGCGGIELKAGKRLCTVKSEEEVMEIVAAFIQRYREEANYGERTYKWLERTGLDAAKKTVVDDVQGRKALNERLKAALSVLRDPWRERSGGGGCTVH